MNTTKNKLIMISLGLIGFLLSTTQAYAATTQKCFEPVRADLYITVVVPAGTYKFKIAEDVVYSYIKAQGSADKSVAINQLRQLINGIPSLLLPGWLAESLRGYYNLQISSLQTQEKNDAISACVTALKPLRLAGMNGVQAPHVFQFLGNIILGEDFEHPPVINYADCNGRTSPPWTSCRKPSDLK